MTRLVVFLTPYPKDTPISILPTDLIACANGIFAPNDLPFYAIPQKSTEINEYIINSLISQMSTVLDDKVKQLVMTHLNDYYSHALQPIFSVIYHLKQLVAEHRPSELVVVSAFSHGVIPLSGFQTLESLRGSKQLLLARLAPHLIDIFPETPITFIKVKPDLWCREIFRKSVIKSANLSFITLMFIKILALWIFSLRSRGHSRIQTIFLARTEHQTRFITRMLGENDGSAIVFIPQATQGSLKKLLDLARQFSDRQRSLSPVSALQAFFTARKESKLLNEFSKSDFIINSRDNIGSSIISIRDLSAEISLTYLTLFHKNLVTSLVEKEKPAHLVNFELVGRMAGLERLAVNHTSTRLASIQTALIASAPLPVFPYSHKFYADSKTTHSLISKIGTLQLGEVCYSGPPYPILPIRPIKTVKTIAFFTQPYEHETSLAILSSLAFWASQNHVNVLIRLHPRDQKERYLPLMAANSVLKFEELLSLEQLITSSDLCITRTSSVAKEAISLGSPVLLCLWSELDNSIKADYINPDYNYIAKNAITLSHLLDDPQGLQKAASAISNIIFAGRDLGDLRKSIAETETL